jgi:hypothetical protein
MKRNEYIREKWAVYFSSFSPPPPSVTHYCPPASHNEGHFTNLKGKPGNCLLINKKKHVVNYVSLQVWTLPDTLPSAAFCAERQCTLGCAKFSMNGSSGSEHAEFIHAAQWSQNTNLFIFKKSGDYTYGIRIDTVHVTHLTEIRKNHNAKKKKKKTDVQNYIHEQTQAAGEGQLANTVLMYRHACLQLSHISVANSRQCISMARTTLHVSVI